jgi:23S rRNA (uracil1939-C5)-methyltransferase
LRPSLLYTFVMNVKELIEVDIIDSGMDGHGVARCDGKVVFIPYVLKGERVRAVVKSVKKKFAEASVVKVLSASPHRVAPECPHYYKCGGCDAAHYDGEYRRAALVGEIRNNLKKIAGVDLGEIGFVASNGVARNKIAMPFCLSGGRVALGMYRHGTHTVELVACRFASDAMLGIAKTVVEFCNAERLGVYDEATGRGLLRHLVLRSVGGRTSVVLVINAERFAAGSKLAALLPDDCDFFISANTRRTNVIMGESVRLVKGNARLPVDVLGVKAELSPLSFFQVNDYIRDRLYTAAIERLTSPTVVDLYSGIGITSNLAANAGKSVIAVECVVQAVEDADRTAALNGNADVIENICGNAEDVLPRLSERVRGADILVDPPRKGCGAAVMRAVAELRPARLVYISCNHATMCRDVAPLISDGYKISNCTAFDMFPDTHHVETLLTLDRA